MNLFNEEVLGRIVQVYDSPKDTASKLHKLVVSEVIDCHTLKGTLVGTNIEVTYHMPDGMNIQILDSPEYILAQEKYLGKVVQVYSKSGKKKFNKMVVNDILANGKVISGLTVSMRMKVSYHLDGVTVEVL